MSDRYQRRRVVAAESREATRRALLAAADRLFRARGYANTPVTLIATEAGVSLQTLYLAWTSKRTLLQAATDAAVVDAALPLDAEAWRCQVRSELAATAGAQADAAAYLRAVAQLFTRIANRSAPYWRMQRDGAVVDAEIASDWREGIARRRRTMAAVAADVPQRGRSTAIGPAELTDVLWGLASPELYDVLTQHAGYTDQQFEGWLARALVGAVTGPDERPPGRDGRGVVS